MAGGIGGIASLAIAGVVFAGWPGTGTWVLNVLVGADLIFSDATLGALSCAEERCAGAMKLGPEPRAD